MWDVISLMSVKFWLAYLSLHCCRIDPMSLWWHSLMWLNMWMVNVLPCQEIWREGEKKQSESCCLDQDLPQFHFRNSRERISNIPTATISSSRCFLTQGWDLQLQRPSGSPWGAGLHVRVWDTEGMESDDVWPLFSSLKPYRVSYQVSVRPPCKQ